MLWDVQLPFNCYETTHTWTPHCHQASVDLFASVLLSTLPLHALLYLVRTWAVSLVDAGDLFMWLKYPKRNFEFK